MAAVFNKSELVGRRFDYESIFGRQPKCFLKGAVVNYVYKNGVKTEDIEGVTYQVVEDRNYDKISVKIKGQTEPVISNEQLTAYNDVGKKIFVEFVDLSILAYVNRDANTICDSYTATDLKFIEE